MLRSTPSELHLQHKHTEYPQLELAALAASPKPTNPPIPGPTMHALLVHQAAATELDVSSAADHLVWIPVSAWICKHPTQAAPAAPAAAGHM
jgi:hypothetical protein